MLIQIVDSQARTIGAMKEELVHEQNLLHKKLILLLYDRDKGLCLKKNKHQNKKDVWDFPVNVHVPINISEEELAEKNLLKLDYIKSTIKILIRNQFFEEKREFISVYSITSRNIDITGLDVIFLQKEEFQFAIKKYSEIFSEYVHWANSLRLTFLG